MDLIRRPAAEALEEQLAACVVVHRRDPSDERDANAETSSVDLASMFKDAFYSNEIKGTFEILYPQSVYYMLAKRLENPDLYHPESIACVALAVTKVYCDCEASAITSEEGPSAYILRQAAASSETNRLSVPRSMSSPAMWSRWSSSGRPTTQRP